MSAIVVAIFVTDVSHRCGHRLRPLLLSTFNIDAGTCNHIVVGVLCAE
jgi:hypothetical protein